MAHGIIIITGTCIEKSISLGAWFTCLMPMEGYSEICEGEAKALFPDAGDVFYNPVQEFNRDVSIAVIKTFGEDYQRCQFSFGKWKKARGSPACEDSCESVTKSQGEASNDEVKDVPKQPLRILEALSATGLRAVRYSKEIPNACEIIANDWSKDAVSLIQRNIEYNECQDRVTASCSDASLLMAKASTDNDGFFDVVDLDPYGSPSQFLPSALQCVSEGGLLCVTCTDMAVLCGNHGDACYGKYGSIPVKGPFCHEMALRILLSTLCANASRYHRYIVPVLCLNVDFYVRVFVQVFTSRSKVKEIPCKLATMYSCTGCSSLHFQPLSRAMPSAGTYPKVLPGIGPCVPQHCQECGFRFHIGGPLWTAPMYDKDFVQRVIANITANKEAYGTADRIIGMLTMASEELPDVPLHYCLAKLSNVLHCSQPKALAAHSALLRLGHRVSFVHACASGMKTDAPPSVVWDMMRAWAKLQSVKKLPAATSPAAKILAKEVGIEVSFEILPSANPPSRKLNLLRYQQNPEPGWGPKCKAKKRRADGVIESELDKRKRLQGKHGKKDAAPMKQYPCKLYLAGKCDRSEEECRYSHEMS